ncbi:oligosaccharide repeat unit polymerase [Curtobacterium flaccumfaciens pv. beticola]|uniref:O-antigen polymerase n=1 Tax=Curtobacterium flaccumfaciens TaxID=2035 RepID=UPI00349F4C36|nr:oligosaccharide repeat unit polymerase [Curtobacterium flaccumfaciens pv. basellae]
MPSLIVYGAVFGIAFCLSYARWHSVLAPASLWNGAWMILFLAAALLGSDYAYPSWDTFLLFLLALSFNIPPFLSSRDDKPIQLNLPLLKALATPNWVLGATAVAGFAGAVHLSMSLGNSLLSLGSLSTILDAGKTNAASIYRDDLGRSPLDTVSYALMQYGFAALGTRLRVLPNKSSWFLLLANVAAATTWTLVTTQRSYFLVAVVWLCGGYIAAAVASRNEKISRGTLRGMILAVASLLIFVVGARAIRIGGSSAQLGADSFAGAKLWIAGYIPTFAQWHASRDLGEIYPFRLISGVIGLLGLPLNDGTSADGEVFTYIGAGQTSNASTMMRAVVLVSGDLGAFLIVIALSAICTWLYTRARQGRPQAVAAYVGAVTVILWSVNAWQFSNGNRVLAQIVVSCGLGLATLLAHSKAKKESARVGQ